MGMIECGWMRFKQCLLILKQGEGPRVIPTCIVYMTSSFDDLFVVNCLCTCIVYMYQLIGVGNYNWLQLIFNMIMVVPIPQGVISRDFPDSTKLKCFTHSHIAYEAILYSWYRPDTLMHLHLVFMGISATGTFHCLSAWLVYNILGVMNSSIGIFMFICYSLYMLWWTYHM